MMKVFWYVLFCLGKPCIGTGMEAFWRHFTCHSPIDFLAYRFILVYVALSDFHIGVMYNSGFFSLLLRLYS